MKKTELKQLIRTIVSEVKRLKAEGKMKDFAIGQMNKQGPAGGHPGASKWDDEAGYDRDDPKHPDYVDRMAGQADMNDRSDDMMLGNTHDDSEPMFEDAKLGVSTMKKSPEKTDNTQMGYEDKSITSTDKPAEKKEGKKLPVVQKKSNTETNHKISNKSTPTVPDGEKTEGKALPVGGHGAKGLKAEIAEMIRESIREMARTKGAVSNADRVADPSSPTGYKHRVTGAPVPAPKNIGQNYQRVSANPNMGRPEVAKPATVSPAAKSNEVPEYTFTFVDPEGGAEELDPELPWYGTNQLKSYLESNVMAHVGNLEARLDPSVTNLLNAIKMKPETVVSKEFTLKYDPTSNTVRVTPPK